NYFMLVNRRPSPAVSGSYSGQRFARVQFDANHQEFAGFNNWTLIDVSNNQAVRTFDKGQLTTADLGWIQPGEIRLYKLLPVMKRGGTFVCDEEITAVNIVCDSTVFNNGYDLRLYQGTKIMFRSKGKIVFSGGEFYSGLIPEFQNPAATEFCGHNGGYWEGISFESAGIISMTSSIIKDIAYEPPGGMNPVFQNCGISLTNCRNFYITGNTFNLNNKSGAVYFQFISDENPNWQNTYIAGNNFILNANNTGEPVVLSFNSLAAIEMPLRIENNFFHNNSSTHALAVSINGIAGGIVKNNCINRFACGIAAVASSIDLYNNMIYTNSQSSKSVEGTYASNINISPNYQYYTGGFNNFISAYDDSKNIYLENSYLFLEGGNNHFNISSYPQNGVKPYHIYGTFPGNPYDVYPASDNCFKIDSLYDDPVEEVTANGNPVVFNFFSYSCSAMQPEDFAVFTSPGIVNDTVAVVNEGMGGSVKGNGENMPETQISPCKSLLDSININVRKRQYTNAETQCRRMLLLYSDSIACFDAMIKLYLASLSQDSAGIKMQALKAFYETVILNNQGKINLINRCFYLIQKCKVALKQYSAAMEGFQLIIQQNPYTYEGLAASWDYAATYLLDSINGQGGGLSNRETEKRLSVFDITDSYDSTRFTKSQRNDITKSIDNAIENRRTVQTEKIVELQKKSDKGDREAGKELKIMKTINETVKTKKPNSNIELRQIIQSDIRKVFIRSGENSKEPAVLIPQTYELYQNYPNPFNPVTVIGYQLPVAGNVKLIVYDILGREVKTLINNEFKTAGKYISEFNGSGLASGIYFARILVNDGKDFVAVKKMVLVK
ncbi:MAG: T9SS type A sorting domain-containing protein, partial [Ignavibacteria bacterium]|nr:T9SS type A sorting domain-containing protein [Ignavibacteria bacterium]